MNSNKNCGLRITDCGMTGRARRSAFRNPQSTIRNGFTIVELMVSIALVLILMIGVSQVFRTTSSTVSAGQAISDNVRVARAAQATFARDFGGAVTIDAPFISIHSSVMPAYRNRQDELGDLKVTQFKDRHELSQDLNGNNIEAENGVNGERIPVAQYGHRSHRTDILTFFVRDLIKRQTGNPAPPVQQNMVSPMTGQEAWVRYCHGQVWDGVTALPGSGGFLPPGGSGSITSATNPNNFYAAQWVLTRQAIILKEPDSAGTINDSTGTAQRHWRRNAGFTPLATSSFSDQGGWRIQESIIDLAGTTIDEMRQVMTDYLSTATDAQRNIWTGDFAWRPCVNPLMPQPLNAQTLAQTVPVFVPGCTQFIVEFAGDFIAQQNDIAVPGTYGNTTSTYLDTTGTDGIIDYVLVPTAGTFRKEIRWYGLPRDTHNLGEIAGTAATDTAARNMVNVVPFRDVLLNSSSPAVAANPFGAPFEKNKLPASASLVTRKANYLDVTVPNNGMGITDEYNCGWGPNDPKPKMIRITLVIDDPAGRLQEGQTFEYVFELP